MLNALIGIFLLVFEKKACQKVQNYANNLIKVLRGLKICF